MWKQCSIDLNFFKKKTKRYQKYPFYTQRQCVSDHEMNRESVWAFVTSSLKHWKSQKEVLLRLCSRKGGHHSTTSTFCTATVLSVLCWGARVCTCVCTVDGSSSRTRCGTGWRWWRASWALPRRPRPTGAPTDRLTGSVTLNCPAGWGWSITEAHKHTSKLFELHWLYTHITHPEGSLKWPVFSPGRIYRMCGAVGSMLIIGGLVSLVGRNAAVLKPATHHRTASHCHSHQAAKSFCFHVELLLLHINTVFTVRPHTLFSLFQKRILNFRVVVVFSFFSSTAPTRLYHVAHTISPHPTLFLSNAVAGTVVAWQQRITTERRNQRFFPVIS